MRISISLIIMAAVIVDFHTHVVSPQVKEKRSEYIQRDPTFSLLYSHPKAKLATAEELIVSMDDAGVDVSVILSLGWVSHELCIEANDYILESISRYPQRLIGFCIIQPQAGEAALVELERCARNGARGIGELRPDIQGFDLTDEEVMGPVVEMAMEHNLILLSHASEPVGHQYSGKGSVTPDILYSFIAKFPWLRIVCAHWGGGLPFYTLMPEVSNALTNVFFDIAATPFLYNAQIFKHAMYLIGVDKVLFGSDYPLLPQSRGIKQVRSLDLPDLAKEMILGANAYKLLGEEIGR